MFGTGVENILTRDFTGCRRTP